MARTDIYGSAISCQKCKKGHRDASCNDSHPGKSITLSYPSTSELTILQGLASVEGSGDARERAKMAKSVARYQSLTAFFGPPWASPGVLRLCLALYQRLRLRPSAALNLREMATLLLQHRQRLVPGPRLPAVWVSLGNLPQALRFCLCLRLLIRPLGTLILGLMAPLPLQRSHVSPPTLPLPSSPLPAVWISLGSLPLTLCSRPRSGVMATMSL
jgi:hypothetical protein